MKIGLTYDRCASRSNSGYSLPTCECSSTQETLDAITQLLADNGHEVCWIGHAQDLFDKLTAAFRPDLVWNLGSPCSRAVIASALDVYSISHVYSSTASMSICSRPAVVKAMLRDAGVPTGDFWLIHQAEDLRRVQASFPVSIRNQSSAANLVTVRAAEIANANELQQACLQLFSQASPAELPLLIENSLPGRSLMVSIVGDASDPNVVSTIEVQQNFEPKDDQEFVLCDRESAETIQAERTAVAAWNKLGLCDAACIYLKCDREGVPYIVHVDAAPDLHPMHSDMTRAAMRAGVSYSSLVLRILESSLKRVPNSWSSQHKQLRGTHLKMGRAFSH